MSISKVLSYFVFLFSLLWLIISFGAINYERSINPDILNYFEDYRNAYWNYDIGYEVYASLLRDFLHLNFESFWICTLIIITASFFFVNSKAICFFYLVTNFYFLAPIMGAQVRYFMAVGLFLFFVKYKDLKLIFFILLPICLIHYGIALAYVMFFLSCHFVDNKKINKILCNRVVIVVILTLGIIGVQSTITLIIPYTRFSYYLDSTYLQGKSISSIIYATISFCVIYYFYRKYSWRQIERKDKVIILFALLLTMLIVITSPIAVLSGRYLLFYIFMEGFLASVVVKYDRRIFTLLLFISLLKWVSIINQGTLTL